MTADGPTKSEQTIQETTPWPLSIPQQSLPELSDHSRTTQPGSLAVQPASQGAECTVSEPAPSNNKTQVIQSDDEIPQETEGGKPNEHESPAYLYGGGITGFDIVREYHAGLSRRSMDG